MSIIKLVVLQVSSITGLFLGYYIAPDQPLTSFMPSEEETQLFKYIELHICFIIGFAVSIVTLAFNKALECSTIAPIVTVSIVGVIYGSASYIRMGEYPQFHLLPTVAYLCGLLTAYGVEKLSKDISHKYS